MIENHIYTGNCVEIMQQFPENSIDLVITSPPYDNLRTYDDHALWNTSVWQRVIAELYRIVKHGGVVVWVVNDATINGSETGTSFRQALYFMEQGFKLHDTMIYEKAGSPYQHKNRYIQTFEYMFVFSKGKPRTTNILRDRKNSRTGKPVVNSSRQVDGKLRKSNGSKVGKKIQDYGARFNIWKITADHLEGRFDKFAFQHPAVFPVALARDHMITWSNENDIVLDPFGGSGTVGVIAQQLKRRYILIEVNPEYVAIAQKRIAYYAVETPLENL